MYLSAVCKREFFPHFGCPGSEPDSTRLVIVDGSDKYSVCNVHSSSSKCCRIIHHECIFIDCVTNYSAFVCFRCEELQWVSLVCYCNTELCFLLFLNHLTTKCNIFIPFRFVYNIFLDEGKIYLFVHLITNMCCYKI